MTHEGDTVLRVILNFTHSMLLIAKALLTLKEEDLRNRN